MSGKREPRVKIIRGKRYIERTKDFYIEEGREKEEHFVRAIKKREAMGDGLR